MKTYNINIDSSFEEFKDFINKYEPHGEGDYVNNILVKDPKFENNSNIEYSHRHLDNHKINNLKYLKNGIDIYKTPNILIGNIFLNQEFMIFLCKNYFAETLFEVYEESCGDFRIFLSFLYRRYLLLNKKIITCIYSSLNHQDKVKKIKDSLWYGDFSRFGNNMFFEVYGNSETTYMKDSQLFLNVKEEYSKLSIKTYKMIEFFNKYYQFDYLLKIDASIIDRDSKIRQYTFDNFENNYNNKLFIRDYDGVLNVENHSFRYIHQWAQSKNMKANPEEIFGNEKIPDFWGGNAYVLSKKACDIISRNEKNFIDFEKHMCGCEDLCVGLTLHQNGIKNWN